jgi:hypothetical protein
VAGAGAKQNIWENLTKPFILLLLVQLYPSSGSPHLAESFLLFPSIPLENDSPEIRV